MAKKTAIVFGVVLIIAGILGWVPNPLVGSGALFVTNHAHDVLNLVLGLVLLIAAFAAAAKSGLWVKIVGVVLLLVGILGLVMTSADGMLLGLFLVNMADSWMQIVLGIVLLVLGFMGKGSHKMAPPASMPPAGGMPGSTM
ncbi:MAG TPA: DUF4383 domain-containing protein [Candidatus Paceibacterota bacterium]|jgi:putative Mn2+ efflux pump MntP|nr:DUF4383 domain-containing protein [Candidatus Paceibacterota bacterium]